MTRAFWVWLHRWAGLGMAGFLILVGLTGSLLAFWLELNNWLTPDLYPTPRAGVELDAATLARRAETLLPDATVNTVYLGYPGSAQIGVEAKDGAPPLGFDFLHLDPIDGHELGRVKWHGLPETKNDIMPFVYSLHMYLAMSGVGDWILGVVALVWTLDCFVGFYLTLPPHSERSRKGFFTRWRSSWLIKLKSSFYRVNFDFHRASGLWLWAILLVYAWSSVLFTLPNFYTRTMQLFFDYQAPSWAHSVQETHVLGEPMGWEQALATGRALMTKEARANNFSVGRDLAFYLSRAEGAYEYRVRSSRDIGDKAGQTAVHFDARTGALKSVSLPTGQRNGVTVTTWLVELHTANIFGLPYRIFVCIVGVVIAALSGTGVYIWWKKRSAATRRKESSALTPALNAR